MAWGDPDALVIGNVDALPHLDGASVRNRLEAQVSSPVRWTQTILEFKARGFGRYAEAGPGKVLAGLVKKIDPGAEVVSVGDTPSLEAARAFIRGEGRA